MPVVFAAASPTSSVAYRTVERCRWCGCGRVAAPHPGASPSTWAAKTDTTLGSTSNDQFASHRKIPRLGLLRPPERTPVNVGSLL